MNPKVSIIVPVYKVEKYLRKCIDSILNQTYENLEIILVNDGSPDNCGEICDEYAEKYSKIIVIHKQNGGLSSARNAGLDVATGDYIGFVDSDDWIEPNMYQRLMENAIKYNAEISVAGLTNIKECENKYEVIKSTYNGTIEIICFDKYEEMKNFFLGTWSAWDKIYKKEVHEDIRFPEGEINEDEAIALKLIDRCERIVHTNEALYNYLSRPNSITTSEFSEKKLDWYKNCKKNLQFINNNYPSISEYAQSRFCNSIMWSLRCISLSNNDFKVISKYLVKELILNKDVFINNNIISKKEKLWIKLIVLTSPRGNISLFKNLTRLNNLRYKNN